MAANISAGEVWAQAGAMEMIVTGLLIEIAKSADGRKLVEGAFNFAEVAAEAGALKAAEMESPMPYRRLVETIEQIREAAIG